MNNILWGKTWKTCYRAWTSQILWCCICCMIRSCWSQSPAPVLVIKEQDVRQPSKTDSTTPLYSFTRSFTWCLSWCNISHPMKWEHHLSNCLKFWVGLVRASCSPGGASKSLVFQAAHELPTSFKSPLPNGQIE